MKWLKIFVVVLCLGTFVTPARAEPGIELENTDWVLGLELGINLSLLLGVAFLEPPEKCSWCATNAFDEAIRSALVANADEDVRVASDWLVFGGVTTAALATTILPAAIDGDGWEALQNTGMVLSSVVATTALVGLVKMLVARERPIEHHDPGALEPPSERFVSFFSGHTSIAFALAASTTTIAYLRGEELAPYAAGGLGALALTGATLRIVGDAHWASDVLVGMGVGTLVGIGLPLLLHPRARDSSLTTSVTPLVSVGGAQVVFTTAW